MHLLPSVCVAVCISRARARVCVCVGRSMVRPARRGCYLNRVMLLGAWHHQHRATFAHTSASRARQRLCSVAPQCVCVSYRVCVPQSVCPTVCVRHGALPRHLLFFLLNRNIFFHSDAHCSICFWPRLVSNDLICHVLSKRPETRDQRPETRDPAAAELLIRRSPL